MTAARLWHRTRVGAGLAAGTAGLVWITTLPWGALAVLVVGTLLSLWAVAEARRMGTLRNRVEAACGVVVALSAALWLWGSLESNSDLFPASLSASHRYWVALLGVMVCAPLFGGLALLPEFGRMDARRMLRVVATAAWLTLPLPLLFLLHRSLGTRGLAVVLALSKIGDVAGYFGGSLLGGPHSTHPFPRLSPGKTLVGCWCSLLTATFAGLLLHMWGVLPEPRLGILSPLLAAALVNLGAQAGDLLESAAKRDAQVKDSGTAFGPAGGLLDLVDSLLLSVPVALVTWPLLFEWTWLPA